MFDVLIKNGTLIDGTGTPSKNMDVAIKDGKIAEISEKISGKAQQVINADGNFVTPGFIDIQNHSDSYWTLIDQPEQISLLAQGITSIVIGNCGSSLAPLLSPNSIKAIQKWHNLSGININWDTVAGFLDMLGRLPLGLNVGTLVGHATLRRGILGDEIRNITVEELKILNKTLAQGLAQGALGLSLGLVYAHEMHSTMDELKMLAQNLKASNKYLSVHLRSEESEILESIDEVIEIAQSVQIPVKISHLKIRGKKNWHLFGHVLNKLELAYHQGVNISFDAYPYSTSWSVLYTYLPKWAYDGGKTHILSTIADSMSRRKIMDFLRNQNHDYSKMIVAAANGNKNFEGKNILQIAKNQNVSSEEAILNIIKATSAQVIIFDHNLSDEQVEVLISSPLSIVATDGAGYTKPPLSYVHPRCFGTIPKFLRLIRDKKILKWEYAIKKITSEPAKLMGIVDRGMIAEGNWADLVIFDPMVVTDRGDYKNPDVLPVGIDLVMVNGKVAFTKNQYLNAGGMVIKR